MDAIFFVQKEAKNAAEKPRQNAVALAVQPNVIAHKGRAN